MSVIPHYQEAERICEGLPLMSEAAYRERSRQQQEAVVTDIDHGRWQQSNYCESFTAKFIEVVEGSRLFVDVGAETGFYTYLALQHMPAGGRIIAVEPDPVRCELLRELFEDRPAVEVLEAAVSDTQGTTILTKPRGCSATCADVAGERFEIATVVLDDLLRDEPVDLIKMDIEGAEARAFAGMRDILARQRPRIFLEYHPWINDITPGGVDSMHRILEESGYLIFRTDIGGSNRNGPQQVPRLGGRAILEPVGRVIDPT